MAVLLVRALVLLHRWLLPCCDLRWWRRGRCSLLLGGHRCHPGCSTLMSLFKLPKALPPNIITWGFGFQYVNLGSRGTDIQPLTIPNPPRVMAHRDVCSSPILGDVCVLSACIFLPSSHKRHLLQEAFPAPQGRFALFPLSVASEACVPSPQHTRHTPGLSPTVCLLCGVRICRMARPWRW